MSTAIPAALNVLCVSVVVVVVAVVRSVAT